MSEEWYVIRTRSHHEAKVSSQLFEKKFNIFHPCIDIQSKRKDRKIMIKKPLFPGYLFICCNLTGDCRLNILKTYGVVNILGDNNNMPIPVPVEQIDSIKAILMSSLPYKINSYLKMGDKVIVSEGALQGAVGIYVGDNTKRGKLIVSVDMLQRSLEVEIDECLLQKF